ncbi:MAG: hypothetical protein LUC88_00265 [Prevotella sp.]|nr:hypothetical protein [Prevotella sp.]
METENIFDALGYFKMLAEENKLAKENDFVACFCSGPDGIDDVMQKFRTTKNFIMIDDITQQNTYSKGVTFFDKNAYTVFILAGYRADDMTDRQEKLNLCRRIFRQMHSRMLHDKRNMIYGDSLEWLDLNSVYSKDLPYISLNGVTGLYFMVNNDEPVDLTYNADEWESDNG